MKTVVSILILILLNSCVYQPWEKRTYINETTHNKVKIGKLPSFNNFKESFVNDAFVNIYVQPKKDGLYVGSAPYKVAVTFLANKGQNLAIINDVEIETSDKEISYAVSKDLFPLELTFNSETYTSSSTSVTVKECFYTFEDEFNFSVERMEKVYIRLNVTIVSEEKLETGWIEYTFKPVKTKGSFQYIM